AAAEAADHAVRDRVALHLDALRALNRLVGVLECLFHGRRHLVGLAVAGGDAALLVADHDQGVEREAPAALDHGRAAPDLHHIIVEAVRPALAFFCHSLPPLAH